MLSPGWGSLYHQTITWAYHHCITWAFNGRDNMRLICSQLYTGQFLEYQCFDSQDWNNIKVKLLFLLVQLELVHFGTCLLSGPGATTTWRQLVLFWRLVKCIWVAGSNPLTKSNTHFLRTKATDTVTIGEGTAEESFTELK